jgi:AbiV family abortive infection protein
MSNDHDNASLDQLISGMNLCRENAEELIADCALLRANQRYPRAYFLAYMACEESAKFFMLELAALRVLGSNPPNWKRFWQRFRAHDSKLEQLSVQLQLLLETGVTNNRDLVEASERIFDFGMETRNSSLYVDRGQGKSFRKPSDLNLEIPLDAIYELALLARTALRTRGVSERDINLHLQKSTAESAPEMAGRVFQQAIERLREAGYSFEEVQAFMEKMGKGQAPDKKRPSSQR